MTTDLAGTVLGGYELTEVVGEGGMATVYKAFQKSLQRSVAVKVLYYYEDNSLARFELEAKAIASLRHRNILIIYEYGEQESTPYIVMEYVDGGTLEDRLIEGEPMAWKRAIDLIIPVSEALFYAHEQGIIHRDIKPSNVLMPQDDWPVLADFGLVKHSDEDQGLTRTGTFMGTPSYIAPEQARDVEVDHRVDMYSVGVMLFEMVTGRLPFDHENPNKILLAHVMEPPPNPIDINPNCPPALGVVILKVLSKSAEDRYINMQAFVNALKEVRATPFAPPKNQPTHAIPSARKEAAEAAQKAAAQDSGTEKGFFGSVKRLFGRKKQEELITTDKPKEDTSSKTAPRSQLDVPAEIDEATIQIPVAAFSDETLPQLLFQEKNITIPLKKQPEMVIGRTYRDTVVDVDLERYEASKYGVSREHARLLNEGSLWLLEDLNSLNGTFVNNIEVKQGKPVVLKDGNAIRLSHMTFIFIQP